MVADGGEGSSVDDGVIEKGSVVSFRVGPIRNPISQAPVSGFQILTLSSDQGRIANGYGDLTISEFATVSSSGDTVTLTASELLINQKSNFLLEVKLPLPLNAGCVIDLYLPPPLFIGPDLKSVEISGMFGQLREADVTLDAS